MVLLSLDRYHFLFIDDFKGNANISVTIKCGFTVFTSVCQSAIHSLFVMCCSMNTVVVKKVLQPNERLPSSVAHGEKTSQMSASRAMSPGRLQSSNK